MRNKSTSKEDVLIHALNIIAEEGLEACTARRLSKELNIAVGTIYNYFQSRDELLKDCFVRSWHETTKKMEEISHKAINLKDKLREILIQIEHDVINRNGLGGYLFHQSSIDMKNETPCHFDNGVTILNSILKQSNNNKGLSEMELSTMSKTILFGQMMFLKDQTNMSDYYHIIISKFL
jgi:AcrR family transcriptional regulator